MYYTMKDHQGSLAAVIQPDGDVERLSYDAWGPRRNPTGFGYDNLSTATFDRGFTLHEHYDGFGLINMNGRMYDPAVGRMLSPDIVIQQEHNSQAYNRYSYCFNNPLRFTDPSGYVVRGSCSLYWNFSLVFSESSNDNGISFNTDEALGQEIPIIEPFGEEESAAYKAYRDIVFSDEKYKAVQNELIRLEDAEEIFCIRTGENATNGASGGNFKYNRETGEFDVNFGAGEWTDIESLSHELKHADQYMNGKLGFDLRGDVVNCFGYDFLDEVEAFERQGMFGKTLNFDGIRNAYPLLWSKGYFEMNQTIQNCAHDNPALPYNLIKEANKMSFDFNKNPIYLYHGWQKDIR